MERGVGRRAVLGVGGAGLLSPLLALARLDRTGCTHGRLPGIDAPSIWEAAARGSRIVYGSTIATWQFESDATGDVIDHGYAMLHPHHAALLSTEDDLLWWRIRPTPHARLDFTYPDRIYDFAQRHGQLVLGGPGLVWDSGFGDGWRSADLWDIDRKHAEQLLYGTIRAVMNRYRRRTAVWSVVNEAIANHPDAGLHGLRTNVPWFHTIGPDYVERALHHARQADPHGMLMLNDYGYETSTASGSPPLAKMRATLKVIDRLLRRGVPLDAFGVQAHLAARGFHRQFDARLYRRFLRELGDRGLHVLITEMDVLDDGLPKAPHARDVLIADVYRRYLDTALESPHVKAVINFGLTDRYTWLDQESPRRDGAHRRPLPFDRDLQTKPQYHAVYQALAGAPRRRPPTAFTDKPPG
jgi:endo-1,4-beta-xylanase